MATTAKQEALIAELDELIGWGSIAAPFIVALTFSPLNFDFFGLPKVTALYLTTLFLLYLTLRRWMAAGAAEVPLHPILLPAGAVLAVATATAMLSASPLASVLGRFNRYESLPALFCYAAILWFAVASAREPAAFARRLKFLTTAAVAVVLLYGTLEVVGLDAFGALARQEGRVSSTLGNPVFFGGFLAMVLPLFIVWSLDRPEGQGGRWERPIIAAFVLILGMVLLVATLSRGAWLGAVAGGATALYFRGDASRRTGLLLWAGIAAMAVGLGALLLITAGTGSSGSLEAATSLRSLENRVEIWRSAASMVAERPLLGYGLDQTKEWFGPHMTRELAVLENSLHDRAHSIYLQWMLDGGAPLALAWLWLIAYALLAGARAARRANPAVTGLVAGVVGFLVQGATGIATNELSVLLWFILGATVALGDAGRVRYVVVPLRAQPAARAAVPLAITALALLAAVPLVAEARYYALTREAGAMMSGAAAERLVRQSRYIATQPYYSYKIAEICVKFAHEKDDPAYAARAITICERARRWAPHAPELLLGLGQAHLAAAQHGGGERDLARAEDYLERARAKAPLFLGTHEALLELYVQQGDDARALRQANLVLSLDARNAAAYTAQSIVYERIGEPGKAKRALNRALELDTEAEEMYRRLVRARAPR